MLLKDFELEARIFKTINSKRFCVEIRKYINSFPSTLQLTVLYYSVKQSFFTSSNPSISLSLIKKISSQSIKQSIKHRNYKILHCNEKAQIFILRIEITGLT